MRNPLPAERWARVEVVFASATQLPTAERNRYVESECGDDVELRSEVLSLLGYDEANERVLFDAIGAGAVSAIEAEPAEGRMLGPWRIERELGRGGMAIVYLAERADGEYRKKAAIKLIRRGLDTAAVIARLRRERRILAALDHPYIARLLDGGTAPEGLPYIVMEYVEGAPIDRYCDQNALGVDERCRLITKVCEAVAWAHRNLIIHSDLKPANILVGPDGNPRLLDFGIARLLTQDDEDQSEPLTRGSSRPRTPEYASPEQMNDGVVGTAADIYSLGVVLYELLAGSRPPARDAKASAVAARNGKPRRWQHALEGDLENILQMAMREEPERRYRTVEQLEDDLRLHLAGMPVRARADSITYRCGKFLRRHAVAAVAASLVTASLVVGLAATLWQARRAAEEKRIADRRFGEVRELARKFLFDFHDAIVNLPGSTPARRMAVETGIHYYDSLAKEAAGNRDLLEEIARGYDRLGDVQGNPYYPNLGDVAGAAASYRKAFDLRSAISDPSASFARDRIQGYIRLGEIEIAHEDYKKSVSYLRQGIALGTQGATARDQGMRGPLSIAWSVMGDALLRSGANTEAIEPYSRSLALRLELAGESKTGKDDIAVERGLATAQAKLGDVYYRSQRTAEALKHLRAAQEINARVAAAAPDNMTYARSLKITSLLLGQLLMSEAGQPFGKPGEATGYLRQATRLADQMAAADPANRQALRDVADSNTALGDWLREEKDLPGASAAWNKGMAAAKKLTRASAVGNEGILSQLYRRLAIAAMDAGRYDEALAGLQPAEEYAVAAEKANPNSIMLIMRRNEIAGTRVEVLMAQRRWREAIAAILQVISSDEGIAKADPQNDMVLEEQTEMYFDAAQCYARVGEPKAALGAMQTALDNYARIASRRPLSASETKKRSEGLARLAEWRTDH